MSDDMSVEAKERAFRKDRVFTPPQREWLDRFERLAADLHHERLVTLKTREILIHLRVSRGELIEAAKLTPAGRSHADLVTDFQVLIRTCNVFAGDTVLPKHVRDLAQLCAVRASELR